MMKDFEKMVKYLDNIKPEALSEYLKFKGWQKLADLRNGSIRQFKAPHGENYVKVLMDRDFVDYFSVLRDTVSIIAKVENTDMFNIISKIVYPANDILKWRIDDKKAPMGCLPLDAMIRNMDYIKNLLTATCLDIKNPAVFHKRMAPQEEVERYNFGQSEIGSYIINLICPLPFSEYYMFEPEEEEIPIARQINIKTLAGIEAVQEAAEDGAKLDEMVSAGTISVNFLNALSDIYEENIDNSFSIHAMLNPVIPVLPKQPHLNKIDLKPSLLEKVVVVAEGNTPREEQNVDKSFYGKITGIQGNANPQLRETIQVEISTLDNEGRKIKINSDLNNQKYYSIVEDAFQNGDNIKVSGKFRTKGNRRYLQNCSIVKLDD